MTVTEYEPDQIDRADVREDTALFECFLDQRSRVRVPTAWVNSRFLFMNPGANRLVGGDERDALWAWAVAAIEACDAGTRPLSTSRASLGATCRPLVLDGDVIGAEVRLVECSDEGLGGGPRDRLTFGWQSLRPSELGIAGLVAEGLTNREVGARLFLSRHTVDFHLRQIYRKLGISSRVELTGMVLRHRSDSLVGPEASLLARAPR